MNNIMNINYIIYGFSRVIIMFVIVVAIGTVLKLLNINNDITIAVMIFNLLLVFCGYNFTEKPSKEKYKNSLLLSIMVSLSCVLIFAIFNKFEFLIIVKNFLSTFSFICIGILIYFFKSNYKFGF
ncbi:hypothetical protein [Acinetobacter guillouiae]|uniref:hypothetical protein n=1 Tax=Acinetobacter guillouiae TaxID=106649 RepID=UPI003AF73150